MHDLTRSSLFASSVVALCTGPTAAQHDPYRLTHAEIADHSTIKTAYEAVEQLRPRFLHASHFTGGGNAGANSSSPHWTTTDDPSGGDARSQGVMVVVMGSVAELRHIAANVVFWIHYLSAADASQPYGNDQSGVIEVRVSPTPIKPDSLLRPGTQPGR